MLKKFEYKAPGLSNNNIICNFLLNTKPPGISFRQSQSPDYHYNVEKVEYKVPALSNNSSKKSQDHNWNFKYANEKCSQFPGNAYRSVVLICPTQY